MPQDFRLSNAELDLDDSRLTGRDCFRCGRRIGLEASGCWVESPATGGIALSAHRDCINGMDAMKLAAAYQAATYAALTGEKERAH